MELTPIFVVAIIFVTIYKIIELLVCRSERLKLIDKLTELPSAVFADKLPMLQNMTKMLASGMGLDLRFTALKWGAFAVGIGAGCIISAITSNNLDWSVRVTFQSGCVLTCGGVGLLIAFVIEYMMRKSDRK